MAGLAKMTLSDKKQSNSEEKRTLKNNLKTQ
jgi:hypothetical protein